MVRIEYGSVKKRRLYDRKNCSIHTKLIGPSFDISVQICNLSIGGSGLLWNEEVPSRVQVGQRVRLSLELEDSHYEKLLMGCEIIQFNSEKCGLRVIYVNIPISIFKRFIES